MGRLTRIEMRLQRICEIRVHLWRKFSASLCLCGKYFGILA